MFDIRYGLYLVIFSMPFYLVRFSVFGVPTTLLEIMIYVLFAVYFLREIKNGMRFEKLFKIFKEEKKFSCGIVLLFAGLLISTAYSDDLRGSLGIVKGWFLDPLIIFLIFVSCIERDKDLKNVFLSWILSGLAVAAIGIGYALAGTLTFDGRLSAFFLSPNHLAMYLAPAFLIFAYFTIKKEKFFENESANKGFLACGIVLVFIPMALSRSYGALFASLLPIIVLIYFNKSSIGIAIKHDKWKYALIAGTIIALVSCTAYGKFVQIYDSNGRSSLHSRLMIWNVSWEMIKESPFVGIGPGTFQERYLSLRSKFNEPYLEWAVPQPHNIFLAFYLQTGLIGFAGFLILLSWVFKRDSGADISKVLMAYVLIHGLVDTTYWKNDLAIMFWLILGASCSWRLIISEKAQNKHT